MVTDYVLLLFSIMCSVYAHNGRCLLFNGNCVDHCPRKMHPYHTRCDVDTLSQRTCLTPNVFVLGYTCGWSRCDCDDNLYLTDDNDCVELEDCTAPRRSRKRERRRKGKSALNIRRIKLKERDNDHLRPIENLPIKAPGPDYV